MDTSEIGKRLTEIRKARGWTLKRIADEVGSEANTVCRHFRTGKMTTDYLIKYAEVLGCTIAEITDGMIDLTKFVLKRLLSTHKMKKIAVLTKVSFVKLVAWGKVCFIWCLVKANVLVVKNNKNAVMLSRSWQKRFPETPL